jgi:hypothetical protein
MIPRTEGTATIPMVKEPTTISIPGLEEIERLREKSDIRRNGDCCGMIMPSAWDLMCKINEIAEKVNILIRIKNGEVGR